MRLYFTLFIIFILFMIAFIFGSQNNQVISLNYMIARTELSIAQAVAIFTSIGFVLGLLTALLWKILASLKSGRKKENN